MKVTTFRCDFRCNVIVYPLDVQKGLDVDNDNDIRQLLRSADIQTENPDRTRKAINRARRQVGQRDALAFALVRIWATLAKLLAPIFAVVGEKQAQATQQTQARGLK